MIPVRPLRARGRTSGSPLESFLETGMEIAREAGALIAAYYERRIGFELKGEYDLVTEADRNSEKMIVSRLRACYPDHDIVAEEGGGHLSGADYRWYVDPLDGTTNFAHGFPVFAVSMGLERKGERVAGIVFDPTRNEMFAAERGAGATLNGAPIRVSRCGLAGGRPGGDRVSQPEAPRERQRPLLLRTGYADPRRPPGRCGCHRPGLCRLRKTGCILGI